MVLEPRILARKREKLQDHPKRMRRINETESYKGQFEEPTDPISHVPLYVGDSLKFLKQSMLEVFQHSRYAEHEKNPSWDLPSHGNAYEDCGNVKVKGCKHVEDHPEGKVFIRFYKRNCRRKQCPICYEGWATAESQRALLRLATFVSGSREVHRLIVRLKKELRENPKAKEFFYRKLVLFLEKMATAKGYQPIHVVASPPLEMKGEFLTSDSYRKMRKRAYRIMKKAGLYGGLMIIHPYRLRCKNCRSTLPDHKKNCPGCGCSEFEWFFSPHFHFVGYGWIKNTKEGYSEHGWIVKNLKTRKSVFATLRYLLSHAGVSSFHTTTWFGNLSYRVMRFIPKLGHVPEFCPYCKRFLHPMMFIGGKDRPPPDLTISDDPSENSFLVDPLDWDVL